MGESQLPIDVDILTLTDDSGIERDFEVLDYIENEKGKFYALLPVFDLPEEELNSEETYFIFKLDDQDNEEQLTEVTDGELLDELKEQFEDRFSEDYDYIEED